MKSNFDIWSYYGYGYSSPKKSKRYGGLRDDDDDDDRKDYKEARSSYYSYLGSEFKRITQLISGKEDWQKDANELKEMFAKMFIPVEMQYATCGGCSIYKEKGRIVIRTERDYIKSIKDKFNEVVARINRMPKMAHVVDSYFVLYDIYDSCQYKEFGSKMAVIKFHKGEYSYEQALEHFSKISQGYPNLGGHSMMSYTGGDIVGRLHTITNKELYKKALELITKKYKKASISTYVESRKKGTRINPSYIKGMSTLPLLLKTTSGMGSGLKVPKVLIINDCSGSMGIANPSITSPAFESASFISALVNSGVVDVTHAVYHSELGFIDMVDRIKSGEFSTYSGGDEGFGHIGNIPESWAKEVDYVIITTDLIYSKGQQQALYNFVKSCKAHMVLSFKNEGSVKELAVRLVHNAIDMCGVVNTLLR